jgi:hypothetical protein
VSSVVTTPAISHAVILENETRLVEAALNVFSPGHLQLSGAQIGEISPRLTLAALVAHLPIPELRIYRGLVRDADWEDDCEKFQELFGHPVKSITAALPGWRPLPALVAYPEEPRFALHNEYWAQALRRKHEAQQASDPYKAVEVPKAVTENIAPAPAPQAVIAGPAAAPVAAETKPQEPKRQPKVIAAPTLPAAPVVTVQIWPCRFADEGRWRVFHAALKSETASVRPRQRFEAACVDSLGLMLFRAEEKIVNLYRLLVTTDRTKIAPDDCIQTVWSAINSYALCALIQEKFNLEAAKARIEIFRDPERLFQKNIEFYYRHNRTLLRDVEYEAGFVALRERSEELLPIDQKLSPRGIFIRVNQMLASLGLPPVQRNS